MKNLACLIIGVLGLGLASLSMASQVYKWTDENGVVHYSEAPPPENSSKASTLNIHAAPPDGPAQPMATPSASTATSGKAKPNDAEKRAERQKACDEWKSDIASLDSHSRIRVMGDDGSVTALSDDDKQKRIKEDQDSIDKYCGDN